jgi:hypothetical protein
MIVTLLMAAQVCFAQDVHDAYARQDTTALRAMVRAAHAREDSLLVRYRLFALTREKDLLRTIPPSARGLSARGAALLSALWAYRIPGSAPWNVVTFGRRSMQLLQQAKADAPDDPLVHLIEAQSLLFRPGIAGGDVEQAVAILRDLRVRVAAASDCEVPLIEVEAWLWYALRKAGEGEADAVRRRILAGDPQPLYRAFVRASGAETPFD